MWKYQEIQSDKGLSLPFKLLSENKVTSSDHTSRVSQQTFSLNRGHSVPNVPQWVDSGPSLDGTYGGPLLSLRDTSQTLSHSYSFVYLLVINDKENKFKTFLLSNFLLRSCMKLSVWNILKNARKFPSYVRIVSYNEHIGFLANRTLGIH